MKISKKRTTHLLFSLFAFLFFSSFVSAELLLGQTESLYNMGDKFEITITISPNKYASDFLIATLVCSNREIELFKSPFSVEANSEKEVIISTNLDNFLVSGVSGECYVKAMYGSDASISRKFQITKGIIVTLNVEGVIFNPEEKVNVHGKATKANSELFDGFIDVTVKGIDFSFVGLVKQGGFNLNFTIPEDAPAGSYQIEARAYEKDVSDMIINEGSTSSTIAIRQVVKKVEIALNKQSTLPTQELTYNVLLYDQAKENAEADVSVVIYKPDSAVFEKKIVRSGETNSVQLKSNFPPGYWKIEAKYSDLQVTKEFFVEELKDLSFKLENQTLVIENIGNVPYSGPVEVSVGGVREIKELKKLAVGESKKFKLAAPNGEYQILVGEGSNEQELGTTFLTGKAISVNAVGEGFFGKNFVILISLITILIIAIIVVLVYKRIMLHRALTGGAKLSLLKVKTDKPIVKTALKSGEQLPNNLIDKGEKQESTVISLKIKNLSSLPEKSEAINSIDSALWKAKEAGAKIYSDGNFRIIIFAPVLTKEQDNSLKAIRLAKTIERFLNVHNKRFAQKIEFGIGVNNGMMIVESKEGKFRFMSLDNIIANTKRISENANSETLISENLHRKTIGKIKTEKAHDKNLWKLDKVIDRTEHSDYVRAMVKRHHHEGKRPVK